MLQFDELNQVYDQGAPDQQLPPVQGPGPKPRAKAAAPTLGLPKDNTRYSRPAENMTPLSNVDLTNPDLNNFLEGRGIPNPQTTGTDLNLMMGEAQSFGSKLGRKAVNLVPNIAAGIIDMVGNVGSLITEWGDNRDYDNGLNQLADSLKDVAGVNYKRSNDTWAISDPTWWIDNIGSVAEMAASFAIGGAGVGRVLGGVAKAATEGFNLGTKASMFVKGAAQLGTSAFVSYAESAQAGAQVYKDTYEAQFNKLLAKGLPPDEANKQAKHIASQSAASTAQLGTLLTMGLNVGAYAPWFRKMDDVGLDVISKRVAGMEASMSRKEIAGAIRGLNVEDYADKFFHHSSWKSKLREMGAEGSEEVLQQFAEVTGREEGKDGRTHNFLEQFGQLEKIIDRTANSQGLLSFTLGAAFGGLQNVLIHNIIPTRGDKMVDGKTVDAIDPNTGEVKMVKRGGVMVPATEKSWATPRSREHDFTTRKFDTLKESVAYDFENFDKVENEMMAAQKAGNAAGAKKARQSIFDVGAMHAVKSGLTEPWKKTFDKIANMDQAAAVEAGYATDENDTSYKAKAQEAIADMDTLNSMYTTLQNKYGTKYQGNENADALVDMVFARQTNIYGVDKVIKEEEAELVEMQKKADNLPGVANIDGLSNSIKNVHKAREAADFVSQQLQTDLALLDANTKEGGDRNIVMELLRKYRAVGMGDGNLGWAVADLRNKLFNINDKMFQRIKDNETLMLGTTEYVEWLEKHPNGKFDDFITEVNDKRQTDANITMKNNFLEQLRTQQEMAKSNLADMTSEKNADRFVRKAEKWRDDMIAETERVQKEELAAVARMVKEKETLKRSDKLNLNRIAEDYRKERDAVAQKIVLNAKLLEAAKDKLKNASWKDPVKLYSVRNEIKALERTEKILKAEFRKLDSLYSDHKVDDSPVKVDTEEATGEENGLETAENEETVVTTTGEEETKVVSDPVEKVTPISNSLALSSVANTTKALKELIVQDIKEWDKIAFDESKQRYRTEEQISELYHKSKADNSNPEFVTAVEALLNPTGIVVGEEETSFGPTEDTPFDTYTKLLEPTSDLVKLVMGNIVEYAKAENTPISLDLLNKSIADGDISQGEATALLYAAQEYLDDLRNASLGSEPEETTPDPEPDPEIEVTTPVILFGPLPEADSPEIDNMDAEQVLAAGDVIAYHAGDKIVDAAETGGSSTVGYHEGLAANSTTGPKYIKVQNPSQLNDTVNEDLLRMHGIPPNTDVEYVVDVDYDGPKHITDSLAWDKNQDVIKATEKGTDYLEDGKVKMNERGFGNVPIKVVDKRTGKTLTHIRKLDWLEMAFPNTLDRRNVVEKLIEPDGTVINNFEIQRNQLIAHRKAIVERFNETGQASTGKTGKIGTGHILLNHVIQEKADGKISSKIVPALASEMTPDTELEIVIGRNGVLESASNFPSTKQLAFDQSKIPTGHVGMLIPTPNGSHLYAPLIGVPLAGEGKPSGAVNSVVRVIELYMFNSNNPAMAAEITALKKETGFDVSKLVGLKGFINQYYTYTNGFQDSVTSPNNTQAKGEKFMFSIDDKIENVSDKTKQIKVAFSRRGQKPVYANVENGKLKQSFIDTLTEGFQERSRAVVHTNPGRGLKGINSKGKFRDAVFINGAWKHNSYTSYNHYIKSFSTTTVYGKNKLGSGEYVYVANPILPLVFDTPTPKVKANDTVATVVVPDPAPVDRSDLDALDDLMNMRPASPVKVKEIGRGAENSKPLTEQSLREIYNFTPEPQRNGKTVLEILDSLTSRGHTFISEGYNPFSKCQ